jgi:hypothetical protein
MARLARLLPSLALRVREFPISINIDLGAAHALAAPHQFK